MKERNLYRKVQSFGPGGYKCPCCGPAPGKQRKQARKLTRRRVGRFLTDLLKRED